MSKSIKINCISALTTMPLEPRTLPFLPQDEDMLKAPHEKLSFLGLQMEGKCADT